MSEMVTVPLADLILVLELAECPANPTTNHLGATERMRALLEQIEDDLYTHASALTSLAAAIGDAIRPSKREVK